MATAHRKIRRKELKEKDEFFTVMDWLDHFFWSHLTQVLVSAAMIVAVVVLVLAMVAYGRHKTRIAGEQFYDAFNAYNKRDFAIALQRFTELADNQPDREVGRLARYYMAACYLAKDDLPRAREALILFLSEPGATAFKPLAAWDLAVIYERTNDFKKAEEYYRQAASAPGAQGISAEFAAARMLERQGKSKEAISAYQQLLEQHPMAAEREDAIEALASMGAAVPSSPTPPSIH
ncbi:MAG TPA: tetratricopeptide repeat protein [Candidatus Binataceae bacterium]|nr:tetratricopeptide repeat protein [Candidatus Binataceae bacterium]